MTLADILADQYGHIRAQQARLRIEQDRLDRIAGHLRAAIDDAYELERDTTSEPPLETPPVHVPEWIDPNISEKAGALLARLEATPAPVPDDGLVEHDIEPLSKVESDDKQPDEHEEYWCSECDSGFPTAAEVMRHTMKAHGRRATLTERTAA